MTIDQLKRCGEIKSELAKINERLERLVSAAQSCTVQYSNCTGIANTSGTKDKIGGAVIDIIKLKNELLHKTVLLEKCLQETEQWLDTLPPQQAVVMRLRYLDGLSWRQVARKSNYSVDHCFTINRMIILKLNS